MDLTPRERALIREALGIACEDGSIYPTGKDGEEDAELAKKVNAEIEAIERKLDGN